MKTIKIIKTKIGIMAISIMAALILTLSFLTISAYATENSIKNNVLRLHILAASDREYDQQIKIKVRNRLISEAPSIFEDCENKEEAILKTQSKLDEILLTVKDELSINNADMTVKVSIENKYFPVKEYGEYTFPAGSYDALVITLGEGEGKNWWCVIFPPLCLTEESVAFKNESVLKDGGFTKNEIKTLKSGKPEYKLKLKLLEWIFG